MFSFVGNCLPKWPQQLASPPATSESPCCPAPAQHLLLAASGPSNRDVVVSQWLRNERRPHVKRFLYSITPVSFPIFFMPLMIFRILLFLPLRLLTCSFAICVSSVVKCLLRSSAHFLIGWFGFSLLSFKVLCLFWIPVLYQICVSWRFSPRL